LGADVRRPVRDNATNRLPQKFVQLVGSRDPQSPGLYHGSAPPALPQLSGKSKDASFQDAVTDELARIF